MTVYFASSGGRLKAGYTKGDAGKRLQQISAHLPEPLILIGTIEGGLRIERAAQKALHSFHLKGEWFQDCEEAQTIVQSIISGKTILEPVAPKDAVPVVLMEVLPENRRKARDLLLNCIWPGDYVSGLSEMFGEPKTTVALWLTDELDMPTRVRFALSGMFYPLLMTGS